MTNMTSECISDDISPQMKFFNMVIPILMGFCSLIINWSIASRIKWDVIQRNVTLLTTSNYFRQYVMSQIFDLIRSDVVLQKQMH